MLKTRLLCRFIFAKIQMEGMSSFTQKINSLTGETEWQVQEDSYDYHQEIARSSFADMLHDSERNKKYHDALRLAIEKFHARGMPANVLDIGTGTGLLSMMAVKCGADSVVACEAFAPVAECALRVISDNNCADKISVIPKRSNLLTVGPDGDLKMKANILVTEVFDTELIGEGALETFAHAHRVLLEKDCIVVPHSAMIYAQVVDCVEMFKWNRVMDVKIGERVLLKTPTEIKQCPGGGYIHDLQLNQLPKDLFREILKPMPVLKFDWSGGSPISKSKVTEKTAKCVNSGTAQLVFMWWDLQMDTEGEIMLSCAPWWTHPDADKTAEFPSESTPWRDHWMQGIYYLPKEISVDEGDELCLVSAHDEFALWFDVRRRARNGNSEPLSCECGLHLMLSRTHISYLNDETRICKFLNALKIINNASVLLCLNGASLIGLSIATKAKTVCCVDSNKFVRSLLDDYVKFNDLQEFVDVFDSIEDCPIETVTHVFADPNFTTAILPWHNLKFISNLNKIKHVLPNHVTIIPSRFKIFLLPVEFLDLHKIRIPLGECEGFTMRKFDELIEGSRKISDFEIESQPLWEYPGYCRAKPTEILSISVGEATGQISSSGTVTFKEPQQINGCALWMEWELDADESISTGPITDVYVGEKINWDRHTRQGVQLLAETKMVAAGDSIFYSYNFDFHNENCNFNLKIKSK